jgi:acylphosphatase
MRAARQFIISGKVQGVGYRYFALRAARHCGVKGTVRNVTGGTVEVAAEGEPASLDAFRVELERGPGMGWVDRVVEQKGHATGYDDFRIIR